MSSAVRSAARCIKAKIRVNLFQKFEIKDKKRGEISKEIDLVDRDPIFFAFRNRKSNFLDDSVNVNCASCL